MNTDTTQTASGLCTLYDKSFYDEQVHGSAASAASFLGYLFRFYRPKSVLDVGCGRGTWLKVCAVDLNAPFTAPHKVDLAMSLEVAEHLKPESAQSLVRSLSSVSDVVLFSAAFSGQGGVNHINERYHSYWGELFSSNGFAAFDMFRPKFWTVEAVEPWYRQNTFLYVRRNNQLASLLAQHGIMEIDNIAFMDCVHPWLYEIRASQSFTEHLRDLVPSLGRALRRRISRNQEEPREN
jgi:hypothetical protein